MQKVFYFLFALFHSVAEKYLRGICTPKIMAVARSVVLNCFATHWKKGIDLLAYLAY
jgi:hypothetical protein